MFFTDFFGDETYPQRFSSQLQQVALYSKSTFDDSKDEASDSGGSIEDEGKKERELEPDDWSSAATREEEITTTADVSVPADHFLIPHWITDRNQEEYDIHQPKKRSRRRHRESSMSPTARGSSSSSTLQEERQKQRRKGRHEIDPGRKRKKRFKKKKEQTIGSIVTDDSSLQSEILSNLSEVETKKIIKVFQSFFGKVCLAIKDPVETAAQLQAKHLISHSTMENVITSPESQQAKAITLVRALDKKIKQRPDKIFMITKVFLESESLQEVGRQLQIEAGKYNKHSFF